MMDKTVVAMYLRLSNEDRCKEKEAESNSIAAQRELVRRHIELLMAGTEYSLTEFVDDGYSGTNFNRPGYLAMIEAAKRGEINMVAVKDFSRFGRDYLEVGRYLEYIFPILQVRFVSVNDGYDSDEKYGETGGMSVALKNIVYGMYSRDLSKKIRSAKEMRVKNGEFIAQYAPYGYQRDPKDKHKLIVDEEAARVVKRIFELAAGGVKHAEIARRLNTDGVPTKYLYKRAHGQYSPDGGVSGVKRLWENSSIREIIMNETYMGSLVWYKTRCGMDTGKKVVRQPKENWIVVENHHEALVSKEVFDRANGNMAGLDQSRRGKGERNGFFFCGYCGRSLSLRRRKENVYHCNSATLTEANECKRIRIRQEVLESLVMCQVKGKAEILAESGAVPDKGRVADWKAVMRSEAEEIEREIRRAKDAKVRLYERYKDGEITREEYMELIGQTKRTLEELEQRQKEAAEPLKAVPGSAEEGVRGEDLREILSGEEFNKELLKKLVDRVRVYGGNEIEIIWKERDPCVE